MTDYEKETALGSCYMRCVGVQLNAPTQAFSQSIRDIEQ
jgi:hypothetical protein